MSTAAGTSVARAVDRPQSGRARPAGWSPGTSTLIGAWIAGAAIARLTGATAVVLLLAAAVVTFVFEVAAGWWGSRTVHVGAVVAPPVVTVGQSCSLLVEIDAPGSDRAIERRRVSVGLGSGAVIGVEQVGRHTRRADDVVVAARFAAAGRVESVTVRVDTAGPAGLFWWRRSTEIRLDECYVAPTAQGPLVDIESTDTTIEGTIEARHGNHGGEIDGIRPWRQGDSTNSVHWASSLRSDELIVHDRLTATDEQWVVDVDAFRAHAGRIRWTLDEARRLGHTVAVRTTDGTLHPIVDEEAAARWSAIVAQAHADERADATQSGQPRLGILQRQVRLRIPTIETDTAITGIARWSAAGAAFASMAMLVGALDRSTAVLGVVFATVALGAALSLWVARRSGRRPLIMQVAIVAAVAVAIAAIVAQFSEVDGLLSALRGPLPDVLMLLVVLHGFETVDRRTLRVHLAITFVLACYAAGLRIDGALGWWLAAWGAPFLVSMATGPRRARTAGRNGASLRRRPTAESAGTVGRWAGSLAVLGLATLAVLSLVPIPDGPARLGLPALSVDAPTVDSPGGLALPDGSSPPGGNASTSTPDRGAVGNVVGYPGFTETLDTSVRGDLGDELVMRVRAPEPAFWRGQTFTEFDGRTWRVSPETGQQQQGPIIDVPPTLGDAIGRNGIPTRELVQTYFVENDLPNLVFAAYRAEQVVFDGALWTRPDGALRSDVTLAAGSVYTVVSQRPLVDADILRSQGDLGVFFSGFSEVAGGDAIDPFLELPPSTSRRTIDLATGLRTPGESTYDTILAYEAWLSANTEYDLDAPVPPDGADAVDDFLFESRLGYCEQIASTLTVMLRSQGVPARLATGYIPGERDRVSGVWNVRASDAHSWVEVWFPQTGWQAFDPTADVPLAADAGGGTIGGDLVGAAVSSIASHRVEIVLTMLAAGIAWGLLRLADVARYRRRRGRWGILQDRFTTAASPVGAADRGPARTGTQPSDVATNTALAAAVYDPSRRAAARTVADELDRAAFDPDWFDDDERFEQVSAALATLERSRR